MKYGIIKRSSVQGRRKAGIPSSFLSSSSYETKPPECVMRVSLRGNFVGTIPIKRKAPKMTLLLVESSGRRRLTCSLGIKFQCNSIEPDFLLYRNAYTSDNI